MIKYLIYLKNKINLSQKSSEVSLTGFTIAELIIVIIMIGALATIGSGGIRFMRENAMDSEARAGLQLIQEAEEVMNLQVNDYATVGLGGTNNVNTILDLTLSNDHWNFTVTGPVPPNTTFLARANRINCAGTFCARDWYIRPRMGGGGGGGPGYEEPCCWNCIHGAATAHRCPANPPPP